MSYRTLEHPWGLDVVARLSSLLRCLRVLAHLLTHLHLADLVAGGESEK